MAFSPEDAFYMRLALEEARAAEDKGEVPVGAVLVSSSGMVLARSHNAPISLCDPTAHAEVLALRRGAQALGNYRLSDTALYVTLEPCAMCLGAIIHARIARVVFGALEPKAGAVASALPLADHLAFNHRPVFEGGLFAEASQDLLRGFFLAKRKGPRGHEAAA